MMRCRRSRLHGVGWLLGGWLFLSMGTGLAQPGPAVPEAVPLESIVHADAFIETAFAQQDSARYKTAAIVYLALLEYLEGTRPAALDSIRARHLVPLALILPNALQEEVGLSDAPASGTASLSEGAAGRLLTWWRRMDPLPATPQNERVIEHLERIAYARRHYEDRTTPTGFDDRGLVYIRLGPPSNVKKIRFDEAQYIGRIVPVPRFIENEFWVYRHVHDAAQYLFVRPRKQQGYRLGLPEDLLPSTLRSPRRAEVMLKVMEQLYRDLALYHQTGHYGFYYDQIANYTTDLAMRRFGGGPSGMQSPFVFIQSTRGQVSMADRRAVRERDAEVPASFTNQFDDVDALPVAVRWARFLDEDGTTRTELYWSVQARELYPSRRIRRMLRRQDEEMPDTYFLAFSVSQQTTDYRPRRRYLHRRLLHLPRDSMTTEMILEPQTLAVHGDTGRYVLALQWDVYGVVQDDAESTRRVGSKLKAETAWIDTLQALRPDPERLEMSDLKPLHVTDTTTSIAAAPPYPGGAILPETPLALYFEVYHLAPAADGQTYYTVAYEVARRGDDARTAATTRYSGDPPTAREVIYLDLSTERVGDFTVTVRVTDETTGQTVERTLALAVEQELVTW